MHSATSRGAVVGPWGVFSSPRCIFAFEAVAAEVRMDGTLVLWADTLRVTLHEGWGRPAKANLVFVCLYIVSLKMCILNKSLCRLAFDEKISWLWEGAITACFHKMAWGNCSLKLIFHKSTEFRVENENQNDLNSGWKGNSPQFRKFQDYEWFHIKSTNKRHFVICFKKNWIEILL